MPRGADIIIRAGAPPEPAPVTDLRLRRGRLRRRIEDLEERLRLEREARADALPCEGERDGDW